LGGLLVLGARVNAQVSYDLVSQPGVRKHFSDGFPDDLVGLFLKKFAQRDGPNPARITRVMGVDFLLVLFPGETDLTRVNHDDLVAAIQKRRVFGLVLADEERGHTRGEPSQDLALGIHEVDFPLNIFSLEHEGFHKKGPKLYQKEARIATLILNLKKSKALCRDRGHGPVGPPKKA